MARGKKTPKKIQTFAENLEEKRELRRLILQFFDTAHRAVLMTDDPRFKDRNMKDVRLMMNALMQVGLLHKSGFAQGTKYITTDDGMILMKAMTIAIPVDKPDSGK